MSAKQKVYLVDGSGYIFRAFYAVPPLTTKDGFPTNALFGFTRMLIKLLGVGDSPYVGMVFDAGAKTFRNELYKEYKANRKECPADLVEQMPLFRTISKALGLPVLELPGFEADDVIGTLAHRLADSGAEVVIVSADKDLMQLVTDKVTIWDTMRDRRFDIPAVKEKFGVSPDKVVEVLGLMGDDSDNIPGLQGCGPKTATQLIEKYGSVEKVLTSAGAIAEDSSIRNRKKLAEQIEIQKDLVRLSRKLVEIDIKVPVSLSLGGKTVDIGGATSEQIYGAMLRGTPDAEMLRTLSHRLEFSSLLDEIAPVPSSAPQEESSSSISVIYSDEFTSWLSTFREQAAFAFDTETTSLDVLSAQIIGASFSWSDTHAYYIPLSHRSETLPEDKEQVTPEEFFRGVAEVFGDPQVKKYGQNLKYDINVFARYGVEVRGLAFDTMVAAYVLNSDRGTYNLTALAQEFLKKGTIEYDEVLAGAENLSFVPVPQAAQYACQDAQYVWLLVKEIAARLEKEDLTSVLNTIEMPLVEVLASMERKGVKLDTKMLAGMSEDFGAQLEVLRTQIYGIAGCEFNLNSPKQLAEVLFQKLAIPTKGLKKTKTGISTDSSVLEKLSGEHPIADEILRYRMLHKLKSTYVDALPTQISPITGRLHSKFNQTVAGTGRLSSSDPNLQNIPIQTAEGRRIRGAFVADEGKILISADYSQIELRLLAHMSGDENLINAFRNGVDIHSKTAREIAGLPEGAEITADQRRAGKTINFGVIYGMSGFRLGKELGIPVSTANAYIENYFARYPGVKRFFAAIEEDATKKGMVTTLFGRKRMLADLDLGGRDQGFMLRAAINAPLQGTAADIIKLAMIRIVKRLRKERLPVEMIMQIHDELVFECTQDLRKEASELIKIEMEGVQELAVPLQVEVGSGFSWQEAHG